MDDQLLERVSATLNTLVDPGASCQVLLLGDVDDGLTAWASEGGRQGVFGEDLDPEDTLEIALLHCAGLEEADFTDALDDALRHLRVGGLLAVVVHNTRHFRDLCRAASRDELTRGAGRGGLTIGAAANLITESGFDIVQSSPARAGYGSPAALRTGFELDAVDETDPARLTTLAHAQVIVARRTQREPDRYDGNHLAGLWEAGDQDGAVAYITRHLTQSQDRARLWNDLAVILVEANLAEDALACVRRAVSCDPFHPAARANLAEMVQAYGDEVGFDGSSIVEVDSELALKHARDLLSLGDTAEALRWAEIAFMTAPSADSAAELGLVLRSVGRPRCASEIKEIVAELRAEGATGKVDTKEPLP